MPSLKVFRKMAGLPDTIRRWSDAAEQVKAGQKALTEQALVSKRSLEDSKRNRGGRAAESAKRPAEAGVGVGADPDAASNPPGASAPGGGDSEAPVDWHPQVHRERAKADGRKPEDFRWDQWPLSNVRIENSENWRIPFWYACDYADGTPLDNQYVQDGDGYRKLPDPVGMCLQSVFFRLKHAGMVGDLLDEQDTLPAEGMVRGRPNDGCELWRRLVPDTSINVELVAFPRFYFLAEDGGMQGHYAVGHQGHFKGAEVESPVYTLSMDHDGNVTVTP